MAFDIVSYLLGRECGISEVSAKKLKTFEVDCTTESSTETVIGNFDVSGCWTHDKIILVSIRDKAGPRTGYFYGADTIIANPPIEGATAFTAMSAILYRDIDGVIKTTNANAGVYASYVNNQDKLRISVKANSSSYTVDGTFVVNVYAIDFIDGSKPY